MVDSDGWKRIEKGIAESPKFRIRRVSERNGEREAFRPRGPVAVGLAGAGLGGVACGYLRWWWNLDKYVLRS